MLVISACSDDSIYSNEADSLTQKFDETAEMRAPAPGEDTIVKIANDAKFTLLVDALEYTGLTGVFEGEDQYTVFAPTDVAFLNLVDELSKKYNDFTVGKDGPFAAIDDLLGEGTVANVLLYHVSEGRRAANSVVPKNKRAKDRKITTLLEGASFNVAFGGVITDIAEQEVKITAADISASNGIIHVVDTVLLPLE